MTALKKAKLSRDRLFEYFKMIHQKDELFQEISKQPKDYNYLVVDWPAGRLDDETKAIFLLETLSITELKMEISDE
jgi:chromosome partitioning protein